MFVLDGQIFHQRDQEMQRCVIDAMLWLKAEGISCDLDATEVDERWPVDITIEIIETACILAWAGVIDPRTGKRKDLTCTS